MNAEHTSPVPDALARAAALTAPRGSSRSLIAGANAWFRAKESTRADRILSDPFAHLLAERDLRVQAVRFGRFTLPPLYRAIDDLQAAHCMRHRAIDELVLAAVSDGFTQVVVIGAGYDMRCVRFADRLAGVRWIELDHPLTQHRKQALLAQHGLRQAAGYGAIDLLTDSLDSALAAAGFDRSLPTCFVLEGLIHYLPAARLEAVLASMASAAPRVRVALSFISTEAFHRRTRIFGALVSSLKEIPVLHFTADELSARCARHRLTGFASWNYDQQVAAFAPSVTRRPRLSQDVARIDLER